MKAKFTSHEKKLITGMSLLMGIRMLGVSLIIPMFSKFAIDLNANMRLVGLAVSIFALSQALFQIPIGRLSDKWGRKEATILGLTIYMIGMVLSGLSENIFHLIIFRFIAGAGAVSGVTFAWITDGVNVKYRNTAVAYVGITIGATMVIGFPLSPVIADYVGTPVLFYICGALTLGAIGYTSLFLKNNDFIEPHSESEEVHYKFDILKKMFTNIDLLRLNVTGFIYSFSFTGYFIVIPLMIIRELEAKEMPVASMWMMLAPPAIVATFLMYFFAKQADKRGSMKIVIFGLLLILGGVITPIMVQDLTGYMISLLLFYSGHYILSPILPVAVSRYPGSSIKGTVMSFYTSSQFFGTFTGGLLVGFIAEVSLMNVFFMLAVINFVGLCAIFGFKDFKTSKSAEFNKNQ